jgi:phenylpyruvate tautomerase PptA (4-oxalocrotonate tautomerase family)
MDISKRDQDLESTSAGGLSRRNVLLMTATAAAGAVTAMSGVLAQGVATQNFGDPVVELYVPPGVLTLEQKSAMIREITDVVLKAMKRSPGSARRLFVAIMETAEGGFGVNGQVFAGRGK